MRLPDRLPPPVEKVGLALAHIFHYRPSRDRGAGPHGLEDGEGVADTTSKPVRFEGVRLVRPSGSAGFQQLWPGLEQKPRFERRAQVLEHLLNLQIALRFAGRLYRSSRAASQCRNRGVLPTRRRPYTTRSLDTGRIASLRTASPSIRTTGRDTGRRCRCRARRDRSPGTPGRAPYPYPRTRTRQAMPRRAPG
jgi:hypothetical protein